MLAITIDVDGDAAMRLEMDDFELPMLHPDKRGELHLMVDDLLDQMAAKLGVYDRLAVAEAQLAKLMDA